MRCKKRFWKAECYTLQGGGTWPSKKIAKMQQYNQIPFISVHRDREVNKDLRIKLQNFDNKFDPKVHNNYIRR